MTPATAPPNERAGYGRCKPRRTRVSAGHAERVILLHRAIASRTASEKCRRSVRNNNRGCAELLQSADIRGICLQLAREAK